MLTEDRKKQIKKEIIGKTWHERVRLYADEKRRLSDEGFYIPKLWSELILLFEV